jgi:hypothetical protein
MLRLYFILVIYLSNHSPLALLPIQVYYHRHDADFLKEMFDGYY